MKPGFKFCSVLTIATIIALGWGANPEGWAEEDEETVQYHLEEKRRGGIIGDPSYKRGRELGYDRGSKAGRIDEANGMDPDLARHDDYMDPTVNYRWEFGYRSTFKSGYRRGFRNGYQTAFGEEVVLILPKIKGEKSSGQFVQDSSSGSGSSNMSASPTQSEATRKYRPRKPTQTSQIQVVSDAL